MRALTTLIFTLAVGTAPLAQTKPLPTQPQSTNAAPAGITLAELERIALDTNPTVRVAQARVDAARGRARQAGAWPNPVAGYTGEEIKTGDLDRRGEHGFFVEQTVPLGGKLRLGRNVFERAAERAEFELELQRQRIVTSVRRVFFEALTTDRRVEIHERLAALTSEAVAITAQLFNIGAADRPDFLESEIEGRRVELELNAAKDRAFALRQELAAIVGDPEIANRTLSGTVEQALPELEREAALRALLDQSPQIRAARAEIARTQALTAQARRVTFPDLFLRGGAAYNREQGEDTRNPIGWEGALEAGLSLPLFNRNAGGVAAARAEEIRAEAELRRLELSLRSRLAGEFATYLTAIRSSESYRTQILPRAEEAYRLYLARYKEMAAAYPQVLIAQRGLFDLSVRYLETLEDAWRSSLRIQGLLVGEGLQSPGESLEAEAELVPRTAERGGRQ